MKLLWVICCLIFALSNCKAQSTKSIELKPIQKQGWRYYYDFSPIKSPYALQIPLQGVEDEEINARFKRFSTFQSLRAVCYIASLVYLITNTSSSQSSDEIFLGLFAGALVLDLSFTIASHHQFKKAVDRYNLLILPKTVGHARGTPSSTQSMGMQIILKF